MATTPSRDVRAAPGSSMAQLLGLVLLLTAYLTLSERLFAVRVLLAVASRDSVYLPRGWGLIRDILVPPLLLATVSFALSKRPYRAVIISALCSLFVYSWWMRGYLVLGRLPSYTSVWGLELAILFLALVLVASWIIIRLLRSRATWSASFLQESVVPAFVAMAVLHLFGAITQSVQWELLPTGGVVPPSVALAALVLPFIPHVSAGLAVAVLCRRGRCIVAGLVGLLGMYFGVLSPMVVSLPLLGWGGPTALLAGVASYGTGALLGYAGGCLPRQKGAFSASPGEEQSRSVP